MANDTLDGQWMGVSLTVNDLERSVAWYRDVAGFTVAQTHEREGKLVAASLRGGNARILLAQDDGARGANRAKGEGFSIMVVTEQNIDALADGIRARGGTLAAEPADMPWGARVFRVHDPDGFRIAISTDPRPQS
ncbi:MAG: VOC family protein [Acidobacteria bacterium]|nr:VOC family protein [Acidobacteriota bacterium]MBV9475476.1 VOC family protein [Acidobacteriota bacterium]